MMDVILPVGPLLQVRIMPVEFSRPFQHRGSAISQLLLVKCVFVPAPKRVRDLGRSAYEVCDSPVGSRAPLSPDPTPFDPVPSFIPVPSAFVGGVCVGGLHHNCRSRLRR